MDSERFDGLVQQLRPEPVATADPAWAGRCPGHRGAGPWRAGGGCREALRGSVLYERAPVQDRQVQGRPRAEGLQLLDEVPPVLDRHHLSERYLREDLHLPG